MSWPSKTFEAGHNKTPKEQDFKQKKPAFDALFNTNAFSGTTIACQCKWTCSQEFSRWAVANTTQAADCNIKPWAEVDG